MLRRKIFERSWVEIDLSAFRTNLNILKSFLEPQQQFMMIVKADAYGHGAREISKIACEEGAVYLGVANPEEGRLLRLQGCKEPVLILSPCLSNEINTILDNDLAVNVSSLDFARALNKTAKTKNKQAVVHLKVDTGMHRSGILDSEFIDFFNKIAKMDNLLIEGVFTHFASAENDPEFSKQQEERFWNIIDNLPFTPTYLHIDNSNALVNGLGKHSNLVRLGIMAYGIQVPGNKDIALQPVMTFKTILSQIKHIAKGESVGYNRSWTAKKDCLYGILPIGYADGYDFMLSNCGVVLLDNKLCNVIGRISMDMICVDLSPIENPAIGDVAILLGGSALETRAENLVSKYGGNSYELLCQVGRRAKRYYFQNGKMIYSTPLSRRDFVPDDFSDSKLNQIIESAIAQRLQSIEIGELIYREMLRDFFYYKDKDIHYRHNFQHQVIFSHSLNAGYFNATTTLNFDKVLSNDYFLVACASSDEVLRRYFKRSDVEYRWLMDDSFELDSKNFIVCLAKVDDLILQTTLHYINGCLEIRCSHPELKKKIGKRVHFTINTLTLYPCSSHQFSVFITELTRGVDISFRFPLTINTVDCVPFFSGQDKDPIIQRNNGEIRVSSKPEEWIFPISGVVFAY
jgi:alanine racemase